MTRAGIQSSQLSRPMLARDADAMYWMSRYVERSEHVARLLLVNSNFLIDVGDLASTLQNRLWQSILTIVRLPELPAEESSIGDRVARHLTFDPANPNSILVCLTRARENARSIRENLSAEMWEQLNTQYWWIRSNEAISRFEESDDDLYRGIMTASMLFQGTTDQTLPHDQRWLLAQLAKSFERIDITCRVIETQFNILNSTDTLMDSTLSNIHWMSVLRSCCSLEAYRRHYLGDMDPMRVAEFLILDREFPRSIRYGINAAHSAMKAIRAGINPLGVDPAEGILGRMAAQLEYAQMPEILAEGLPRYLQRIQAGVNDAALALQQKYFLR